jgi:hypothetical protein
MSKIIELQRAAMDNGLFSPHIIMFPKVQNEDPAQEQAEQKEIMETFSSRLTGSANGGKVTYVFVDPSKAADLKAAIQVIPLSNNEFATTFNELNRLLKESIITALGVVSPDLVGLPSPTGFASQGDMLIKANELQYYNTIRGYQRLILEPLQAILDNRFGRGVAKLTILNGLPVTTTIPAQLLTNGTFTRDEIRAMYGYQPFTGTDQATLTNA